jgi:hypothetical protein
MLKLMQAGQFNDKPLKMGVFPEAGSQKPARYRPETVKILQKEEVPGRCQALLLVRFRRGPVNDRGRRRR